MNFRKVHINKHLKKQDMSQTEEPLGVGTDLFVPGNYQPIATSEEFEMIKKMDSSREMGRKFGVGGTPEEYMNKWLERPNTKFNGKTPRQMVLEGYGEEVKNLIESIAR